MTTTTVHAIIIIIDDDDDATWMGLGIATPETITTGQEVLHWHISRLVSWFQKRRLSHSNWITYIVYNNNNCAQRKGN